MLRQSRMLRKKYYQVFVPWNAENTENIHRMIEGCGTMALQ